MEIIQALYVLVFFLIPVSTILLLRKKNNTKSKTVLNSLLVANTIIFLLPAATVLFDQHSAAPWAYLFLFPLCTIIQILLAFLKINSYYTKSPDSNSLENNNKHSLNRNANDFDNTSSVSIQTTRYIKFLFILGILTVPASWFFGPVGIPIGIISIILSTKRMNLFFKHSADTTQKAYKLLKAGKLLGIIGTAVVPVKLILCLMIFFNGGMPPKWLYESFSF